MTESSRHASPLVLGADIGGTNLRVAIADGEGRILAGRRVPVAGVGDPPRVVASMRELACSLLSELAAPATALRAVGAGVPGLTDTDRGVVIATSYLMGWKDVPLQALLEDAFGVPAAVDNDVNMAALGESRAARGPVSGRLRVSGDRHRHRLGHRHQPPPGARQHVARRRDRVPAGAGHVHRAGGRLQPGRV